MKKDKEKYRQQSSWSSIRKLVMRQPEGVKNAEVGAVTIAIVTPALYLKNMLQTGQKPSVKACIRGIGANGASYVPTSVVAMAINDMLLPEDATSGQKVLVSAVSGAASGMVSSMPEMVVQTKQGTGVKIRVMPRVVTYNKAYNVLGAGMESVMLREGMFAPLYLSVAPLIAEAISKKYPDNPSWVNTMICSIIAGVPGGILTTPPDVIRAQKQLVLNEMIVRDQVSPEGTDAVKSHKHQKTRAKVKVPTVTDVIRKVGFRGLWNGATPRSIAVSGATFMMIEGRKLMKGNVEESNVKSKI